MKNILSVLQLLVGLSAMVGGYGVFMGNGMGMPTSWLERSPFDSYLLPGLVLFFVVGGSYVFSSYATWRMKTYAPEAAAIAGFGIQIWIVTQLYIIRQAHWLQILYFTIGILTLISVMIFLKYYKRKESLS